MLEKNEFRNIFGLCLNGVKPKIEVKELSKESYAKELIEDGTVIKCDFCLEYYPKEDLQKVKDSDGEEVNACDGCIG